MQIAGKSTQTWATSVTGLVGSLPGAARPVPGVASALQFSSVLSAPREGYNNPPISGENLIGLSRARRLHNAVFVNFEDDEVPTQPLEAAAQTWRRVCTNPVDRAVEEELRKVSAHALAAPAGPWARPQLCLCSRLGYSFKLLC